MMNAPLPPDVTVTQRLQMVIAQWKADQHGYQLDRLYQDCLDLVGQDKHLLPLRVIAVRELDSDHLERALRRFHLPLMYGVEPVGRFEAALVPVVREQSTGFVFVYEEALPMRDQVALFAHAVGHLILNHQQHLAGWEPGLDPEGGLIHVDTLAELRYLDVSEHRNYLNRQVLRTFPELTKLIELPEESEAAQSLATRDLVPFLRRQGWTNQFVKHPYRYTQGRVIPNSARRGKRLSIDALLRAWQSVPTAVVHVQRAGESEAEAVRRVLSAVQQLRVPFGYIFTHHKDFVELDWLAGETAVRQVRDELPTREELQDRWLQVLGLNDPRDKDTLSYPFQPAQMPRYYQEVAINQAVIATLQARRGLREPRILLTLATGTGKTQVAFQILWKLKQTRRIGNVLFLADRGYLLDQAQTNTFWPFGDAIIRGMGEPDIAHDIVFATYQWLTYTDRQAIDAIEPYKNYPRDYFDVIVIDECHRGSADEHSNWHKVLEYFADAVQIGLTATPLDTGDVRTKDYFGPSVYTYSLSQGINDGFLAPYSVRRILIGESAQEELSTKPQETLDQQIVMQTGNTMRAYTETIAEHLANYLRHQAEPRGQKTIVFCVNNEHADEMRVALERACADWSRPGDIVRIVDDDGTEGKRTLGQFCTPRERQPVIVTTSRLLSTGVDVPTCKNIVLARGVGSIVEFKQIIGRGTRLSEPEKVSFTILDYAGAIKHFFDPNFDGDPTSIQCDDLRPTVPATPDETGLSPETSAEADKLHGWVPAARAPEQAEAALPPTEQAITAPNEDWKLGGDDYPLYDQHPRILKSGPGEEVSCQEGNATQAIFNIPPSDASTVIEDEQPTASTNAENERADGLVPDGGTWNLMRATSAIEATTGSTVLPGSRPTESRDARPRQRPEPGAAGGPPTLPEGEHVEVKKADGRHFRIVGEVIYELDRDGKLKEGTCQEFVQEALKEWITSLDDLRQYWCDKSTRKLLTDQLAQEVVALDALEKALKLPDVDHFDLLLHVLFGQPTISRAERVQRLRSQHREFFQRFEANPVAKGLLDGILDKYMRGEAVEEQSKEQDVSNMSLLLLDPLKKRSQREWIQFFQQELKANLKDVLKELQQLLFSV